MTINIKGAEFHSAPFVLSFCLWVLGICHREAGAEGESGSVPVYCDGDKLILRSCFLCARLRNRLRNKCAMTCTYTLAPCRESGFAYGRSEASPDSEQIEHVIAEQFMRNSVSVEQIQDRCVRRTGEGSYFDKIAQQA